MQGTASERTDWSSVKDGNASAMDLFRRHYTYNAKRDQGKFWPQTSDLLFVGPGEKMVLLWPDGRALFVWRKEVYRADGQEGVNCAIFRNEGAGRASDLIRAAHKHAWSRWPGERFFTYVDPRRVESKRQPGRCFLKAGWRYVRHNDGDLKGQRVRTKKLGLFVLEMRPEWRLQ